MTRFMLHLIENRQNAAGGARSGYLCVEYNIPSGYLFHTYVRNTLPRVGISRWNVDQGTGLGQWCRRIKPENCPVENPITLLRPGPSHTISFIPREANMILERKVWSMKQITFRVTPIGSQRPTCLEDHAR